MSDERLSDVTRSVSLLARWSPTPGDSDCSAGMTPAGGDVEVDASPAVPCTDKLRRFSGPIVYGLECGVRRRTASRWSRALPLVDDEGDDVAAAIAIARAEELGLRMGGGENRGGDDESCEG